MTINTEMGYERRVAIGAPRERVFDAIGTVQGIRNWWTPIVTGSAEVGGELHLGFAGLDEYIVMRVDALEPGSLVRWTCVEQTRRPEWRGTSVTFELTGTDGGCELSVSHTGLAPELVELGWERFLVSLAGYVERGDGRPYRGEAVDVARAYHDAWSSGDFDAAAALLDPALEVDVPVNSYATKEAFVTALAGFGSTVESVDLLAEFGRSDEALLLYDLAVGSLGRLRVAEQFTVADGRIVRIRHVHDTAPFLSATA
jgi:uncharacterized protein YndB with AHSA1/START domain